MNMCKIATYLCIILVTAAIMGCVTNKAPYAPVVNGEEYAYVGDAAIFYAVAEDPDDDQVSIQFDWGDGQESVWSEFVASGTQVSQFHFYSTAGVYYVRARAEDEDGKKSSWSTNSFEITIYATK